MRIIENKNINELNYDICEYILRNRIQGCIIHCASVEIIDSLALYMTEIGIPWGMKSGVSGVSFSYDYDLAAECFHICIVIDGSASLSCKGKDVLLFSLRDIEEENIKALSTDIDTFNIDQVPIHLQNEEIRKMFLKTFIIAQDEIDIISPWMNFSVVNNALINLMKQALQRGVHIRIIYGLNPSSDEFNQIRSERSDQVATKLKESFVDFGDAFSISRDNIHYKLVLCDEKFKLEGGFNYLSFTGDYSDPNTRKEGSPFGRDVNEIRHLRKVYFKND